jgi:hypothetical protein
VFVNVIFIPNYPIFHLKSRHLSDRENMLFFQAMIAEWSQEKSLRHSWGGTPGKGTLDVKRRRDTFISTKHQAEEAM